MDEKTKGKQLFFVENNKRRRKNEGHGTEQKKSLGEQQKNMNKKEGRTRRTTLKS